MFLSLPLYLSPPPSSLVSPSPVICAVNLKPGSTVLWTSPALKKETMASLLVSLCSLREDSFALAIIWKVVYIFYLVFSFSCGMGSIQFCHSILPTTKVLISFLNSSRFIGPQSHKKFNEWTIKHNLFKNCKLWFNLIKCYLCQEYSKYSEF